MTLRDEIIAIIRREGPIPFSRYMALCLYHSDLGYYSRRREKFGKAGDFYTSSDVHAVFGRLLARQFEEMWRLLDSPATIDLIELGPGRGLFAQDVLDWAGKKFPEFAAALRYRLVESSPDLRRRLQERFSSDTRVSIFSEFEPAARECGDALLVFGNEFFDAIPVEIVSREANSASGNPTVSLLRAGRTSRRRPRSFSIASAQIPSRMSVSRRLDKQTSGWSGSPAASPIVVASPFSSTTDTRASSYWQSGTATLS